MRGQTAWPQHTFQLETSRFWILRVKCSVLCIDWSWRCGLAPPSVGREGKAHFDSVPKWKVTRLLHNAWNSLVLVFGGKVNTRSWLAFPIPVVSLLYCKHCVSGSLPFQMKWSQRLEFLFSCHALLPRMPQMIFTALLWTLTIFTLPFDSKTG